MVVKRLFKSNSEDLNIKNEPFPIIGKLIPIYDGKTFSYEFELFEKDDTDCLFDQTYDYDKLKNGHAFIGAYIDEKCVGIAILKHCKNKYMYLYDFKVISAYRRKGVASKLIDKAKEIAKENEYLGIYTICQDNNLIGCKFYLKNGFKIGGIDTKIYNGTPKQDKKDIIFYLDI